MNIQYSTFVEEQVKNKVKEIARDIKTQFPKDFSSINYTNQQINIKDASQENKIINKYNKYETMENNINKKNLHNINMNFENQFEPILFNNKETISYNQLTYSDSNIDKSLKLKGLYSEIDDPTNYDAIPNKEKMTNNMAPFTSHRDMEIGSDNSYKLGTFTGSDEFYMSKKDNPESAPLFEPTKDLTYVNGMPVMTDEWEARFIPSYKNNHGDLPFANNQLVGPGTIFGNQDGRYQVYRTPEKSVDELRSKTNPKVSFDLNYTGPIKGSEGVTNNNQGDVTQYKKPDFRETPIDTFLPNSAPVYRQKKIYSIYAPNTQRQFGHVEHGGGAFNKDQGVKIASIVQRSGKISYIEDPQRNVSNVNNKPVLQNSKSFTNVNTNRSTTSHNIAGQAQYMNAGSYNINDNARQTIKETTIHQPDNLNAYNTSINQPYMNNDQQANQTIKQTTIHQPDNMTANNSSLYNMYMNNDQDARSTIKQTTIHQPDNMTANNSSLYNMYMNNDQNARSTIKQTTIHQADNMTANNSSLYNMYIQNGDNARNTIKQTTVHQPDNMTANNSNLFNMYIQNGDNAKRTIKQTTVHQPDNMTANNSSLYNMYIQNGDDAKKTIKQTTLHQTEGFVGQDNYNQSYINNEDQARTTNKQTTLLINHNGSLHNSSTDKQISRMDAENMELNCTKEISTQSRFSNPKSDIGGVVFNSQNVRLKEQNDLSRDLIGHQINEHNNMNTNYTRNNFDYSEIDNGMNDIMLLEQLQNNPYAININN